MTVESKWLDHANPTDLLSLARALSEGRLTAPYTASAAQLAGAGGDAASFLESLRGTDPAVIAWMLERLAQERRRAADRFANVAQLVFSGASEGEAQVRDTRVVLDGLFSRAERHVLLSTYVIYQGRSVFSALTQRIRERPEIEVELYVNLPSKTGYDEDERPEVEGYLQHFAREHWPVDLPLPSLYYDPEGRKHGPSRTSLHAKCVVIDHRWAFVTSANFTEAAQERNIEAGVLLDHPGLSGALVARFKALRDGALLRRMQSR